jgi:hypothetical protein
MSGLQKNPKTGCARSPLKLGDRARMWSRQARPSKRTGRLKCLNQDGDADYRLLTKALPFTHRNALITCLSVASSGDPPTRASRRRSMPSYSRAIRRMGSALDARTTSDISMSSELRRWR